MAIERNGACFRIKNCISFSEIRNESGINTYSIASAITFLLLIVFLELMIRKRAIPNTKKHQTTLTGELTK